MSMRKILSAALATVILVGTMAMTANAAANVSITATTTVTNPTYSLGVPKAIGLALNPKEVGGKAQVVSSPYIIVNKSNVPVAVRLSVYAQPAAGVKLIDSSDVEDEIIEKPTRTDKVAALSMVTLKEATAAASVTGTGTTAVDALPATTAAALSEPRNTEGGEDGDVDYTALVLEEDITLETSLDKTFLLNYGKINATTFAREDFADDFTDYTAFTFTGDLSGIPAWVAGDISLSVVYDAATLSKAATAYYAGEEDDNLDTTGWRTSSVDYNPIPRVFGVNITAQTTETLADIALDLKTTDLMFSDDDVIKSVSIHTVATGATAATAQVIAGFAFTADNTITLKNASKEIYTPATTTPVAAAKWTTGFKLGMNTFYLRYVTADGTVFIEPINIYFY